MLYIYNRSKGDIPGARKTELMKNQITIQERQEDGLFQIEFRGSVYFSFHGESKGGFAKRIQDAIRQDFKVEVEII